MRAVKYVRHTIIGQCPGCHHRPAIFRFHGQQLAPPTLWKEMGRKINLYTCGNCGTTVSKRRIAHQRQFRCINNTLHRAQLVRRINNQDTYKWVSVGQNPYRNHN